jgi:hypothetical protein
MLLIYFIITGTEIKITFNPKKPKEITKSWFIKTIDIVKGGGLYEILKEIF